MFELTYFSEAKKGLDSDSLASILKTSQEFNSKNKITGCLLYHHNQFVQILEGEEQLIKELYGKIKQDKRHYNVTLLSENTKDEPIFADWNMAFYELSNDEFDIISESLFISNFIALSELADKPTTAVKLFWHKAKDLLKQSQDL